MRQERPNQPSGTLPSTISSRGSGEPPDMGTDRQIAGLIARLLLHYWTGEMSAETRRLQALDWLEDLREFGPEIVAGACGDYRRTETRRPTPADIRRLCIKADEERRAAQPLALPAMRAERAEIEARQARRYAELQLEGRAIVNKWAKGRGYPDIDAYAAAEGIDWDDAYRRVVGTICAAAGAVLGPAPKEKGP